MTRFASPLIAAMLCGTALAGCASDDITGADKVSAAVTRKAQSMAATDSAMPTDVESGVRQAQLLRVAGKYDEAIHILSQLMLVASDDSRVIGEYGKALAEKGRARDAEQFLTRATQLQPNDWTLYSALGVADDQLGDQKAARVAYERALALKPGEASVLNNYALSRMLANDPVQARQLIARAQIAGGGADPKIARNIALVNQLASAPDAPAMVQKAAPTELAASAPLGAPPAIAARSLPPAVQTMPVQQAQNTSPAAQQVVMQRVPVDPLAGPHKPATRAPTPLVSHDASAKKVEPKLAADTKAAAPAKPADAKAKPDAKPDLKVAAKPDAKIIAKAMPAKPDGKPEIRTAIKSDAAPAVPAPAAKPAPAKPDAKNVKAADAKPDLKPQAKPDSKPDAKPAAKPDVKAVAKTDTKPVTPVAAKPATKPDIPALRQTASAY